MSVSTKYRNLNFHLKTLEKYVRSIHTYPCKFSSPIFIIYAAGYFYKPISILFVVHPPENTNITAFKVDSRELGIEEVRHIKLDVVVYSQVVGLNNAPY